MAIEKGDAISAGAGTAVGVGVVATGTAGMSAAGLTATLASVGGIVGGGMAAGIVVVAAIPVVTGAVGYGLYRLVKWAADPYRV